jgi:hypothetical protein
MWLNVMTMAHSRLAGWRMLRIQRFNGHVRVQV